MIYLLATIKLKPEGKAEFMEVFEKEYKPACERLGRKLVAQWTDAVSPVFEIYDLWEYESLSQIEDFDKARFGDKEYMDIVGKLVGHMLDEHAVLLKPTSASPLG